MIKHNNIIYIIKQSFIHDKTLDIVLRGGGLYYWVDLNLTDEAAGLEDKLNSLWLI